jgi:hypothetical protein
MKRILVLLWLLLPLPVVVLHYGPGQQWLAKDKAHAIVQQAEQAGQKGDWEQAGQLYASAASLLTEAPADLKLRLDLAQVRARFHNGQAVEAIDSANRLLSQPDMRAMPAEFQREARELAGRIHYYAGWVMRLEGANRDLWLEQVELARQNFRLLAEQSAREGQAEYAKQQQENLESAVQLQRLSMTELMARPLPEEGQGMGGQGLSEQMARRRGQRGQGQQPGRGEGDGPPAPGAGMDRFQPGSGS